jgi:hypothetical protein
MLDTQRTIYGYETTVYCICIYLPLITNRRAEFDVIFFRLAESHDKRKQVEGGSKILLGSGTSW